MSSFKQTMIDLAARVTAGTATECEVAYFNEMRGWYTENLSVEELAAIEPEPIEVPEGDYFEVTDEEWREDREALEEPGETREEYEREMMLATAEWNHR